MHSSSMVDTLRRRDTFLLLVELLVSFLQMSDLCAASTDILLSLSILLLESSSESSASCRLLGALVCTRRPFPNNRCDWTNLTLSPLLSLSEGLSGGVAGFDVNPCFCMKWAFLSSADAKVLPQLFSKHLVDGHHLVPYSSCTAREERCSAIHHQCWMTGS